MNFYRAATFALLFLAEICLGRAQQLEPGMLEIIPLQPGNRFEVDLPSQSAVFSNGVVVKFQHPLYGAGVLVADVARIHNITGDIIASGNVRIQRDELVWTGDHIQYNFVTRKMTATQFRAGGTLPETGLPAVFVAAENVSGDQSNQVYSARHALLTTEDIANPTTRIQASSITIIPGEAVIARNAVLLVGGLPVFYFPYYKQRLDGKFNHFDFVPGYRSRYGGFLLTTYNWEWSKQLDGALHLDYRSRRGVAGGADANLHLGRWGEAGVKYYALQDDRPDIDNLGFSIPANRERIAFTYDASPATNFTIKSQVRYQGDERLVHNFFESEYRANPQPSTYVELNQRTDNFSFTAYVQPRINDFLDNVERLPELRLTGFRQQLWETPFYYDSETSAGFYRRRFAETNGVVSGADYEAARADTYQQLSLPLTYLGWLQLTPRVGGRFTYYTEANGPGATTEALHREVFHTGAELTFKASQTWSHVTNRWLALDGVRHIVQPSANYIYVPEPNRRPDELPQFDVELPSLRLLPLQFPDYTAVDSVDSQNVVRLGLRNRLQTKRAGVVQDFFYWDVYADCRLDRGPGQRTLSDIYSDVLMRPRSWFTVESLTRFDVEAGEFRLAFHSLTLQPNSYWSWGLGHLYVRDDFAATPTALQEGNSFLTSSLFLRLNENWGFRAAHQYEVKENWLQQQTYSVYRDFRNWTAALAFRIRDTGNGEANDYGVAFTVSLKAAPRYGVGDDVVRPTRLLGY